MPQPAQPEAAGRLVAELLEEQKDRIAAAKGRLADVLLGPEHDEIFLLRYCLSYPNDDKLDDAVKFRMAYYEDPANKEVQQRGKDGTWNESSTAQYLLKHIVGGFYSSTQLGGPMFWARPGQNPNLDFVVKGMLAQGLDVNDIRRHLICIREHMFWECDRITRSTGKLCKSIMITDLDSLTASHIMQRELTQANSAASNASSKLFPQLLLRNIIINPPAVFSYAFGIVKKFFSAKAVSKIEVFNKNIPMKDQPFVKQWMKVEELPFFVGGNVPNDELPTEMNGSMLVSLASDKSATTVKVKSRDEHVVVIPVVAGLPIKCSFDVAAYGIHIAAKIVEGSFENRAASKAPEFVRTGNVEILQELNSDSVEICGHWDKEWECNVSGRFAICFSNKHSMMRNKEVTYKVWQEHPELNNNNEAIEKLEEQVSGIAVEE